MELGIINSIKLSLIYKNEINYTKSYLNMPYIKVISDSKEIIIKYGSILKNSIFSNIFGDCRYYDVCILILENADNLEQYKLTKGNGKNYYKLKIYKENVYQIWFNYLYVINIDNLEEFNSSENQEEKIRNHFSEYNFDGSDLFTQNSLYSHDKIIYLLQDRIKRKNICWYNF